MQRTTLLLLTFVLAAWGTTAQGTLNHIADCIDLVATPENIEAVLGAGYSYNKSTRKYNKGFGYWIDCGVHKDPDNEGKYIEKIKEFYASGDHMDLPPMNGMILEGLKAGERYDKVEGKLKENAAVTYIEPGGDMNGKLIEFGYKRADGQNVHFHLRFRPRKSKWYLTAFYVRKYR